MTFLQNICHGKYVIKRFIQNVSYLRCFVMYRIVAKFFEWWVRWLTERKYESVML